MKDVIVDVKNGYYCRHFPKDNKFVQMKVNKKGEVLVPMGNGKVQTEDKIMLADVPLMAPNGDELGNHISFLMEKGQSCLVVGPNGCGKTSLFRILASVWPIFQGNVIRPPPEKVFFLPQRAYLPKGTLRDLVIYPHLSSKKTDEELFEILSLVKLEFLLEREGSWEAKNDWADCLSGGERQRMSFARLFYHNPMFAILDEATSAVSIDFEGILYLLAKERGITFFTVSQRNTLYEYHKFLLKFDGSKEWSFEQIVHNN